MTLLSAYLAKSNVKKTLQLKPGQEGFSLIELVVVVAVLGVLSAIAIPQFTNISQNAKARAAANTVATMAKECAVKITDGGGSIIIPNLQGYTRTASGAATTGSNSTVAGFVYTTTVAAGTTPVGNTPQHVANGSAYTCNESHVFGLSSIDLAAYPSFYYNTSNAEKKCAATASSKALDRGCSAADGFW